ncbi:MAG: hypothetical protein Q9157_001934 [Trypethelium eluteriae]
MGSEGSSRLSDSNNQVMASAFKQIFKVDKSNQGTYNKVMGSRGCQDPVETLAQTYKYKDRPDEATDQNPDREVITVCDRTFSLPAPALLSAYPEREDFTKDTLVDMDDLLSLTLFHEFCHLTKVINIPGGNEGEPNGWYRVATLDAADAFDAADSFAFLGLSAILNQRNFRIASDDKKAKVGEIEWITPPERPETGGSKSKRFSTFGTSASEKLKHAFSFKTRSRRRAVAFTT